MPSGFERHGNYILPFGHQHIEGYEHWLSASEHQIIEHWPAVSIQSNKLAIENIAIGQGIQDRGESCQGVAVLGNEATSGIVRQSPESVELDFKEAGRIIEGVGATGGE
jgi:hypothetical protein